MYQKHDEISVKDEDSKENIVKKEELVDDYMDSDYYNSTCASGDETMETIVVSCKLFKKNFYL